MERLYKHEEAQSYVTFDSSGDLYACTEYGDCGSYLTPAVAVELAMVLLEWAKGRTDG